MARYSNWYATATITVDEPENKLNISPKTVSLSYPVSTTDKYSNRVEEMLTKKSSAEVTYDTNGVIVQCDLAGFLYQEITLNYDQKIAEEIEGELGIKDYILDNVTASVVVTVQFGDEDQEILSEE
jgi:hypothetical protein